MSASAHSVEYSAKQMEILRHALGLTAGRVEPYRNFYCTGPHDPELCELERLGAVARAVTVTGTGPLGAGVTYRVTPAAQAAAIADAKREAALVRPAARRYRRWREIREVRPDLSFREFLTSDTYEDARRECARRW